MKSKTQIKYVSLFGFLILCFFVEYTGSVFTASSVSDWYPGLKKAGWTPPPYVFGPVWTVLYILIAVAGWLIYMRPKSHKRTQALKIYGAQLFFNLTWSFFFFYYRSPSLGFLNIFILLALIAYTVLAFWRMSRASGYLLLPYFLWTLYAMTLNAAIWILNE